MTFNMDFPSGSVVKNLPTNARDTGSIPGSWRFPGEGNGNPLQYCCLGNPTDRGTCWATVYGINKELDTANWLNNNSTFRLHFFFRLKPLPALLRYTCMLSCSSSVCLCDPMGCSMPASFVHGILQTRILEWIIMPFSRDLSDSENQIYVSMSPALAGRFFFFFLPLVPQGSHYWGIIDNENCAYLKDTMWWFHVCTHCEVITTVKLIKISMGLPWWMSGKESAFQCRRHRFDLGPGRSHMPQSMWCMGHDYWACALEPRSLNCWARVLQLLKPTHLESVLFNKRSHQ